jgi:hypothetical protein
MPQVTDKLLAVCASKFLTKCMEQHLEEFDETNFMQFLLACTNF